MTRDERVRVYKDTKRMCDTHSKLQASISTSIRGQRIIRESKELLIPPAKYSEPAKIIVSQKRTFAAATAYSGQTVCVHNFASAGNPGGGVVKGSLAQEESLCRSSTLHACLLDNQAWNHFYLPHREIHNPLHNDDCIYTPGVIVFKDDGNYCPLPEKQWFSVDVITCAAPDNRGGYKGSAEQLEQILLQRIRRIMTIAVSNGAEVLVTGAWGCGVFANPPTIVANAFMMIAQEFRYHFKAIEFAVFCRQDDDENYQAFRQALTEAGK